MDLKGDEMVPRPLGETVHGARSGEVIHVDYRCVDQSGPLKGDAVEKADGPKNILVTVDDVGNSTWSEPSESCTAVLTAKDFARLMQGSIWYCRD